MPTAPDFAPIDPNEIDQVARFLAAQVRVGEAVVDGAMSPEKRLRWLLLDNPRRSPEIPLGWRIRDGNGTIAGAAVCIPFQIGWNDGSATALMFAKFFVDPPFRGSGLGLLMRFVREGEKFPLFCTSTNEISAALFSKLGARQMPGMDHTMLGAANIRPLAEELIFRRIGKPRIARLAAGPLALIPARWLRRGIGFKRDQERGRLRRIENAAQAAAICQLPPTNQIAVVRDEAYLHWRYFSGDGIAHVFGFEAPGSPTRLVVVNLVRSGYRGQIRVLNVLDVWPPTDASSAGSLAAALIDEFGGRFDAIWLRSQAPAAESALASVGFRRHDFPAPLGWFLDKHNRLPAADWYSVPGESE